MIFFFFLMLLFNVPKDFLLLSLLLQILQGSIIFEKIALKSIFLFLVILFINIKLNVFKTTEV